MEGGAPNPTGKKGKSHKTKLKVIPKRDDFPRDSRKKEMGILKRNGAKPEPVNDSGEKLWGALIWGGKFFSGEKRG